MLVKYFYSYMSLPFFSFYVNFLVGPDMRSGETSSLTPTKSFELYVLVSTECSSFSVPFGSLCKPESVKFPDWRPQAQKTAVETVEMSDRRLQTLKNRSPL